MRMRPARERSGAAPLALAGGLALGLAWAAASAARRRAYSFRGRVVLITGGSRGLGLELARRFVEAGARVALLARDGGELGRARGDLAARGGEAMGIVCDVRDRSRLTAAVNDVAAHFGRLDVLVNNAGVMLVAPLEHVTPEDLDHAMAVHCFAPLVATLAALPHLRRAGGGRIVNIASIGGKVAVPHMLAYTASKFALVGLSDGLRAELRRENILVTTVCPGPMRTGSHRQVMIRGRHRREYAWFALADSLPLLSIGAASAARRIVAACRRGTPRVLLGLPARVGSALNELLPGLTAAAAAKASGLLPAAERGCGDRTRRGRESESAVTRSFLTSLSRRAASHNNEGAPAGP